MNRKLFPALALLAAILLCPIGPGIAPQAGAQPIAAAAFVPCVGAHRITCIVDGDTFWYRGEKIRVADINAPELSHPQCAAEARLAAAATVRMAQLLGAGAFTLSPWPQRAVDRYGRSLYVVERAGRSLGAVLTAEGLAERWHGRRGSWCDNRT